MDRLEELCGRRGCCSSISQYIESHLDPDGVLTVDDDPEEVIISLMDCFPDLLLTVEEMQDYLRGL